MALLTRRSASATVVPRRKACQRGPGQAPPDSRHAGWPGGCVLTARSRRPRASPPPDHSMLLTLAIILFVLWVLCVVAFKVTFAVVHLLVILAVIAIVLHFVRKARTRV